MKRETLYIFDIDGTLTDSITTYLKVISEVFYNIGFKDIDTDFNNYLHHTDLYALEYNYERNFKKKAPEKLRYEVDQLFADALLKEAPVKEIPGASKTLSCLRERDIAFAYGTGAFPKPTVVKMKQARLPLIEAVLATSICSVTREGFVLQAIEKAKKYYNCTSFNKVIAVGDGVWDLKAAQNVGIDFIGVGQKNKKAMQDLGCKEWVENLIDFPIA